MDSASEEIVTSKKPERVLLVSSQFPSGVAWLLNVFVELGILVYRGASVEEVWSRDENKKYQLTSQEALLKQWIPSLCDRDVFTFENGITVEWTHDFPPLARSYEPDFIIHFIRDGRDAVYSHHKRKALTTPFEDWLTESVWPIDLPASETWALHTALWCIVYPDISRHTIRFEDAKNNPEQTIKILLEKIGVQRTSEEISLAIERSAQDRARKVEDALRDYDAKKSQVIVNRKGMPYEWKTTYTSSMLAAFDGFPKNVLDQCGYDVDVLRESTDAKKTQLTPSLNEAIDVWTSYYKSRLSRKYFKGTVDYPTTFPETIQGFARSIFRDHISSVAAVKYLMQIGKRSEANQYIENLMRASSLSHYQRTLLAYQMLRSGDMLRTRRFLQSAGHNRWLSYLWRQRPNPDLVIDACKQSCKNLIRIIILKLGLMDYLAEYKKRSSIRDVLKRIIKPIFKRSFLSRMRDEVKKKRNFAAQAKRHAEKQETLRALLKHYPATSFVETGTYYGDMIEATINLFQEIYSIELSPTLFQKAKERFKGNSHVHLFEGDSAVVLPTVLKELNKDCFFWLDAHYSKGETARGPIDTPILSELQAILSDKSKKHVILIDDARCFIGQDGYPTLKEMESFVHEQNSDLRVFVENDIIHILPKKV